MAEASFYVIRFKSPKFCISNVNKNLMSYCISSNTVTFMIAFTFEIAL